MIKNDSDRDSEISCQQIETSMFVTTLPKEAKVGNATGAVAVFSQQSSLV